MLSSSGHRRISLCLSGIFTDISTVNSYTWGVYALRGPKVKSNRAMISFADALTRRIYYHRCFITCTCARYHA